MSACYRRGMMHAAVIALESTVSLVHVLRAACAGVVYRYSPTYITHLFTLEVDVYATRGRIPERRGDGARALCAAHAGGAATLRQARRGAHEPRSSSTTAAACAAACPSACASSSVSAGWKV